MNDDELITERTIEALRTDLAEAREDLREIKFAAFAAPFGSDLGRLVAIRRVFDTAGLAIREPIPTLTPAARGYLASAAAEARIAGEDPVTQAALDAVAHLGIEFVTPDLEGPPQ